MRHSQHRKTTRGGPRLRVGFVLADRFTLSSFASFVDALRLAADDGDGSRPLRCSWTVMSSHRAAIQSSCGLRISPTDDLCDPCVLDYVVVIGGALHMRPALTDSAVEYLRHAAGVGTTIVGISTGTFLLCRAGLMTGHRCCVHWYDYNAFTEEFPEIEAVADRLFLFDRDRITCPGGAGVSDLALHLIDKHCGPAVAQKTRHIMQLDRARPSTEPQPFLPISDHSIRPPLRRAILLMEQNITEPLPITTLASRSGVTVRQFERLFKQASGASPRMFYRELRLRYASWLLRNTKRSITQIAQECGFADCAHLSREIRRTHSKTPTALRAIGGTASFPRSSFAASDLHVTQLIPNHRFFDEPSRR